MSTNALRVYRHSGKFAPHGLLLPLIVAVVLGIPLGLAYGYIIRWVPFIYINFIVTLAYGGAFGWVTSRLVKLGRVRNTVLAGAIGAIVGLIAVYFEWSGHLHTLVKSPPFIFAPDEIANGMAFLYEKGSWGLRSSGSVTGIALAIVWVIEAGIIIGCAAVLPVAFVKQTPFCEDAGCWLDEEKTFDTLEKITDPARLAPLKEGDIMPLVETKPKPEGASGFTRLTLKRSPKCDRFSTLQVHDVTVTFDEKGERNEKTRELTDLLVLPASMFDLLSQFADVSPASQPVAANPPTAS